MRYLNAKLLRARPGQVGRRHDRQWLTAGGTLRTMSIHPFDQALALTPGDQADRRGHYTGQTQAAYANMIGPFGGLTAALALQAVLQHPDLLGEPVALTVNFAAAEADGPFQVRAVPARNNRSTQHWTVEFTQPDAAGQPQVVTTATAMTALPRQTWAAQDAAMPSVPPPDAVARVARPPVVAWLGRYEMRPISGDIPTAWDGQGEHSLSQLWLRDAPPRPLDHVGLTALADLFYPRVWLRRATRVPAGTVSMTVYFHATAAELAATGRGLLLGQARAQTYRHGFFDQSAQLWNQAGQLLASSHQLVYFKH